MTCFCSAKAGSLLASLRLVPPTLGLVPPISANLGLAMSAATGMNLALSAAVNLGVPAAVIANLTAMASLSAATKAAMGVSLTAALPIPSMRAQLLATINSFNANSGAFTPQLGPLISLQADLAGLANLAGLLLGLKATLGIDLRAPGAIVALQAWLQAPAPSLAVSAQVSAISSLMATLGLKADAHGALAAGAMAAVAAQLTAGLPALGNLNLLALLAGLLPMLDAIKLALGVDLRAPNSVVALRAALSLLPLSALAQLSATIAVPTPSLNASLAATANAAAPLDLSAVAAANLSGVAPIAMALQVTALGGLGLPAGECGQPCPLALIQNPPQPNLSASISH